MIDASSNDDEEVVEVRAATLAACWRSANELRLDQAAPWRYRPRSARSSFITTGNRCRG